MRRKLLWSFVIFVIFISIGIGIFLNLTSPYKALVIENIRTGEILWKSDIKIDEWFEHQYIHSVEKSPVIEKFRINDMGEIITMESWTKSFGAGLPFLQQGNVEMIDGFYVMRDLNRPTHGGVLQMKPSTLYPHTFHFREQELQLSEAPFAKALIKIETKQMTWLEAIMLYFKKE